MRGGDREDAVFSAPVVHRAIFLRGMQVSLVIAALLLLLAPAASLSPRPAPQGWRMTDHSSLSNSTNQ